MKQNLFTEQITELYSTEYLPFTETFRVEPIFKIGSMNLFSMDVYLWQLRMYF